MAVKEILLLGNPVLRNKARKVDAFDGAPLEDLAAGLRDTLYDFRSTHGFGRGIAAPQIGVLERVIVIHLDQPLVCVNPVIIRRSRKLMTLWDDCFSFPNILAKVKRHLSVEVEYHDMQGKKHSLHGEGPLSELLQHEIDHLDGILAIDRAIDSRHIVFRSEVEKWEENTGMRL